MLKGATLFSAWTASAHRATRDIDLLGIGDSTENRIRKVFQEVLTLDVPDDGVHFDPYTLTVEPIREDQEYGGLRVEAIARITTARIRMQIDIGFGDAITPGVVVLDLPTLLDHQAPRLRAYPRETVVAEKVEALVRLGMANSRMKDFYDLRMLAMTFSFDGELLARAIRATFERRKTTLPLTIPVAFTEDFASDPTKKTQWSGFVRKAGLSDLGSLAETMSSVADFVETPLLAAAKESTLSCIWNPPGPWN